MNTNRLYELALPLLSRRMVPDWLIAYAVRFGTETMLRSQWRKLSNAEKQAYEQTLSLSWCWDRALNIQPATGQ
jgi:hypothetical protein